MPIHRISDYQKFLLPSLLVAVMLTACAPKAEEAAPSPDQDTMVLTPETEEPAPVEEAEAPPEEPAEEPVEEPFFEDDFAFEDEDFLPETEERIVPGFIKRELPKPPVFHHPDPVDPDVLAIRLEEAWQALARKGMLAFELPVPMKVGVEHRGVIRITHRQEVELLTYGMLAPTDPLPEHVNLETRIWVNLTAENLDIQAFSDEEQPVLDRRFAMWEYALFPKKSGVHPARIAASVQLTVNGVTRRPISLPAISQVFEVESDLRYWLSGFLGGYGFIILILGFIAGVIITMIRRPDQTVT